MDVIHIHLAVDRCLAAFEMVYQDKTGAVEVTDFFVRAVAFAMSQPEEVDVNEILFRPTRQAL
jgi:NADP-dependent 3-hydroxy acid dehydrogenase YdfG